VGSYVHIEEAETLKRQADVSSPDPRVARAGQVVRDRLAPLVEEIRGSLDYYLAQSQTSTIDRILVTGGGSRIAGLMERLQGQLGANVEPAHPLNGLRVGKGIGLDDAELADIESLLTVPIGLAMAGEVRKGVRRITLVPREVAVVREQRRQVVMAGAGVVALATLLVGGWVAQGGRLTDERAQAKKTELQAQSLQREVDSLADTVSLDTELAQRRSQVRSVLENDVAPFFKQWRVGTPWTRRLRPDTLRVMGAATSSDKIPTKTVAAMLQAADSAGDDLVVGVLAVFYNSLLAEQPLTFDEIAADALVTPGLLLAVLDGAPRWFSPDGRWTRQLDW